MKGELREGWTQKELGGFFELKYGKGLTKENRIHSGQVNVYGSNGIVGIHNKALTKSPVIIIGRKGSVGEVNYSPEPCWPIDTTYYIDEFPSDFPPNYWKYFLKSLQLGRQEKSSAIPGISRGDIYKIEVSIPPINEQRRIVAKLEKLLEKVEASRIRLEKIPAILKRFRQSVLAAACSGRLTADWRAEKDLNSADWPPVILGEVADLRLGKMLDKAKNIGSPTRYLRNINVRWFAFDLSDLALMRATAPDKKKLTIVDGDLLVCEGGEPGRCAIWNLGKKDLIFQKAIHRVRPMRGVSSMWLALNIWKDANSARLDEYFTGTTIKHLTGKALAKYRFLLPTLPEQQEIVRRIEELFPLADRIEARYQKAKAQVDKLTQSILAKAFRGELVPQDPKDEPVIKISKRILR